MNLEAVEVASMIEILAKGSSIETCKNELLLDASLLETTVGMHVHSIKHLDSPYRDVVLLFGRFVEKHPLLGESWVELLFRCSRSL